MIEGGKDQFDEAMNNSVGKVAAGVVFVVVSFGVCVGLVLYLTGLVNNLLIIFGFMTLE